jgi:hypothetical protein
MVKIGTPSHKEEEGVVAERQDFWLEAKKINGLSALNIFNNMKV